MPVWAGDARNEQYRIEKLHFRDNILLELENGTEPSSLQFNLNKLRGYAPIDFGIEMGYTRSYTYYPYGDGWAKVLGAASGSAPSMSCSTPDKNWNLLDMYKPRASP